MPRPKTPSKEIQRQRQERYRSRLQKEKAPEVGIIDTVLSVALSVYCELGKNKERDMQRIEAIERLATAHLVSRGKSKDEASRLIRRRIQRLDVGLLIDNINGASRSI